MAIRFDNIEAINLLNNQGEQTIALTNDQGITVSGAVNSASVTATGTVQGAYVTASNASGAANGTAQEVARFVNTRSGATSSYMYIGAAAGTDWRLGKNILGTASDTNFGITKHSGTDIFLEIDGSGNTSIHGTIGASNFSGSSSGTNTGDQTLPTLSSLGALSTSAAASTYLPLAGGTLTGGLTGTTATFSGLVFTKIYKTISVSIANSYVRIAEIDDTGGQISSTVRVTLTAHGSSHVTTCNAIISVGHSQDILIQSDNLDYTTLTLKVESNSNGRWTLSAKSSSANSTAYKIDIQGLSNNISITPTPTTSQSGTTLEHTTNFGTNITGVTANTPSSGGLKHQFGGKMFFTNVDSNTDSTTALVLDGNEVEKRTLGSNAFNSTAYITSQRAISSTPTDGATTTAISSDWAFDNVKTAVPANAVFTDTVNTFDGAYSSLSSIPSTFAPSAHNHDDRYYTESEMKTFLGRGYIEKQEASNAPVGWYTVAQNSGDRAFGEFQIWDTASSRHQSVIFNAAHHFGTDDSNSITVLGNSSFSTDVFRYIRIKENGTYDGAAIQVYIDNSTNALGVAIIGGNAQTGGWALVDWLADDSSPSAFTGWENATEKSKIDLDNIHGGGIATTGKIYAGGATSQNEVYHTGNLTPLTIGTTSTTAMAGNTSLFDGAYSSLSGTPTLGTAAAAATGDFVSSGGNDTITHATNQSGLGIYTSGGAVPTVPQLQVGRGSSQYWGVMTADHTATLIHRQDETGTETPNTQFQIWASSTGTAYWSWSKATNAGASPSEKMKLTDGSALTLGGGSNTITNTKVGQWDTAYTDRNKWDGGSTGLTASTGRTSLGLGTAATAATGDFATAAQGTKADNAAPKDYESIADLGSPDAISGTWVNASTTDWGTPRIGSSTAKYTDGTGYIQFDIPDGMKSAYLSQLTWSSGGYFYIYGIQSDGGAVLLRVVNSKNSVENSNEGNPNQHDGSTTVFAGTGLDNYSSIRIQNKYGRLHLTGLGFTSSTVQGAEGMGLVHPHQLSTSLAYSALSGLPTLGTAAAAATTDFATAAQGTKADSALQSLPSHNHNDIYYQESEIRLALARINGWEAGYGSGTASNIKWSLTEEALELRHDTDTSIGAVYKAVYMEAGETKRFTVMIKGSSPSDNGMYLRLYQHDGDLPHGKTHVSNDAQGTFVQEDDRGDNGWYENGAVSNSWTTFEREYKAPANGYVSLVVLNWTGVGLESLFIKTPDIQTVYAVVESGSIGISELAVSDGTTGQVLTTNGSGTLSFATVTSGTSYGWSLSGTDIESGDEITLAGGLSLTGSNGAYTLTQSDNDTVYTHPTGAGNKHIPSGGSAGQFLKYSSSGTATWATPSYTTNTDTQYSAGGGLDLTSTTFSVEPDLRDGITHVGKDSNNYIQFDSTNGRIDFYAGGVFVARMESDGDLHMKGDVIAYSDIFS